MGTVFRRPPVRNLLREEPDDPKIDRERIMLMAERNVARGTIAWAMGCSVSVVDSVIYEESGVPSPDDPTPEQIEAACLELQESWTDEQKDLARRLQPRLSSPLVARRPHWRPRPQPVDRAVIAERRRPRRTAAAIAQRAAAVNALLSRLSAAPPESPAASPPISPAGSTASAPSTAGFIPASTSTPGPKRLEGEASRETTTPHEQRLEIDRCCTIF